MKDASYFSSYKWPYYFLHGQSYIPTINLLEGIFFRKFRIVICSASALSILRWNFSMRRRCSLMISGRKRRARRLCS